MLKEIEGIPCDKYKTTIDHYVPIAIEAPNYRPGYMVYYRMVPDNSALVEIGLDSETGQITELSLMLFKKYKSLNNEFYDLDKIVERTVPRFDLSIFPNEGGSFKRIDDEKNFTVVCGKNFLTIQLSDKLDIKKKYRSGNVVFGIDAAGILQEISVLGLTSPELDIILRDKTPL